MSTDETEARTTREQIIESLNTNQPDLGQDSVCVAWVAVTEWCGMHGTRRWLSVNSGNAAGDELPSWTKNGMLDEALNGDWTQDTDDGD